jgi:RimJ/RimL family protein N-acetyltransferase
MDKHALEDPLINPYAIIYKDKFVGNVVIDKVDNYLKTARLSIYLGETCHRGKRIGVTSSYLAIKEGFDNLALHKLWVTIHCKNIPSINTFLKLGFLLEGILRDEFLLNGERINLLYFGLLEKGFSYFRPTIIYPKELLKALFHGRKNEEGSCYSIELYPMERVF